MRNHIIALLFLLFFFLSLLNAQKIPPDSTAQGEKSLRPLSTFTTRAVVVGISDYQDEVIPDLQYAHRDAEAFAAWLSSPAGGGLSGAALKTLLNEQATTGKIIAALDGLINASNAGDLAIIYFSGHGDVERVTKFQRGYWLTWDSPPAVYAAGAFSLVFLQDIITTLAEAGVQVVVVSDACRAGKLAGSEFGGAQATAAALSKQFANEIKILSCQPNEFSLEGEQWGGGRGAFSYHLLDALYGLADQDEDDRVTVKEINRYLEDHVPVETAPHRQNPVIVGDKETRLARVIPETLAQWRQQKTGDAAAFKKIDPRGFEDLMLAGADSSIRALYEAFTAALEQGYLMPTDSTVGRSANDFYERLIKEPSIADLHGLMTRNFAAALMDEGQQVINKLLQTDPAIISNVWAKPIQFDHISGHLNRAAELLGEKHYVYPTLKTKEFYFLEKAMRPENFPGLSFDSIVSLKQKLLERGLAFDSTAAYLWEGHFRPKNASVTAEFYAKKALEYSPNWALAHFELAGIYIKLFGYAQKSIEHFQKSMALSPDFTSAYNWISWPLESIGEFVRANEYREVYIEKIKQKLDKDTSSVSILELKDMGNALWRLRRYREAINVQKKVIGLTDGKYINVLGNLICTLLDQGKFEESLDIFEQCCYSTHFSWMAGMGDICFYYLQDSVRAEAWYDKTLRFNYETDMPQLTSDRVGIARLYRQTGRPQKALETLLSVNGTRLFYLLPKADALFSFGREEEARTIYAGIANHAVVLQKNDRNFSNGYGGPDFVYQAIALHRLSHKKSFEKAINRALEEADAWRHFWLACIFAQTSQPEKAILHLGLSEKSDWHPNPVQWIYGTVKDELLDPLRHLPEFQAWEKRWSPPYKDYSK